MKLMDLMGGEVNLMKQPMDVDIRGLTANSREVEEGFLFAALPGVQVDGASFIEDAISRGAAAVLMQPAAFERVLKDQRPSAIAFIEDDNPRKRLSLMAARFYGSQPETVAAVTGTNGKTSVASFARQIWSLMGFNAASLGTLGVVSDTVSENLQHTTPDPVHIQKSLKALADHKVSHLALEASSHGLAQYRLDGVRIKAAAFTNLSQDHLDYHKDIEDYFFAKLRLFGDLLPPDGAAVLNSDTDHFSDIEALCWARGQTVMAVGEQAKAEPGNIRLEKQTPTANGQALDIIWDGHTFHVNLPLMGGFQASNALIAAGLVIACGGQVDKAFAALDHLAGVPGRMQWVGKTQSGAAVFVDYAHTPDALANVLKAIRPHTKNRLHVVFGAGGDRDQSKRPLMGKAASECADAVIVTDDNPRGEEPRSIRKAILAAVPSALEISDRAEAIERAIANLDAGDILVVAGKGHETGQIIGDEVLPFNDEEEIRRCLKNEKGGA